MSTSVGSVSSRAPLISAPLHQPFIATSTAFMLVTAQKSWSHSGQFAAQTATRSPGLIP
ncbi:hypothetical protein MXD58_001855 [Frankia sp. AgKG'84/4]|nr:hypothetical protein [Frankia sp. AgKG'84/4]MCL9793074.1 hypothetical protein [Frankia sp. AgKG'84/4]